MGLCDDNIRNMINPYTATGTFGISWNGGYKPDETLEYIRPFDHKVQNEDPLVVPPYNRPSNIFLKTQEARRYDIMTGGQPPRIYEDRECKDPYKAEVIGVNDDSYEDDEIKVYNVNKSKQDSLFNPNVVLILIILVLGIMFLRSLNK